MRYTITHRGTPVAVAEAGTPEHLGSVVVELLPAFESLRALTRAVWRDRQVPTPPPSRHDASGERLAAELEVRDATGAWLPTRRVELWVTGPQTAVAFVDLDRSFAAAPARVPPAVGEAGSAAPEV